MDWIRRRRDSGMEGGACPAAPGDEAGFSGLLRQKIAQRRTGGSAVAAAAAALRQQALERVHGVHAAVARMVAVLGQDPVFAAAFGPEPALSFDWSAGLPDASSFKAEGPAGSFHVRVVHEPAFLDRPARVRLSLLICPHRALAEELGCGWLYGEASPVEGGMEDLGGFIAAAEDMLAEFLADAATAPSAAKFLPGAA